ncbi:MAG: PilZ domain-containing protein [Pseudomonadota bacterium]
MLDRELSFSQGVSNYDELSGADGSKRVYRAPRIAASTLFKGRRPHGRVDGRACMIDDISFSGATFIGDFRNVEDLHVGSSFPLRIEQSGRSLYEGRGTLVRIEDRLDGQRLAFSFNDGAVDLVRMQQRNTIASVRSRIANLRESDNTEVPAAYRALCADAVAFLNQMKAELDEAAAFATPAEEKLILEDCALQMRERWAAILRRGNAFYRDLSTDRSVITAAKIYTERTITPILVAEDTWRRAYEKPLGYPGDYLAMDAIYANETRGRTLFEKFLHQLVQHTGRGLVSRMRKIEAILAEGQRASTISEPFRAMSIGCGPAREIVNRLNIANVGTQQVFTLIDQDEDALALATSRCRSAIARAARGDDVIGYNSSFMDVLRKRTMFFQLPLQNLVYSVGVFDYLSEKLSRSLVRRLAKLLKPGGRLVVANLNASEHGMMWQTAALLDWELYYRDSAEMLAMADGLDDIEPSVETDALGMVEFLILRKTA